mgnify:CR=1 FL=1
MHEKVRKSNAGAKPIDVVLIFKILVLQQLHNLSDDRIEYQIRDRLSFMRFPGLQMEGRVPDAKTVWLFRERLKELKLVEVLFAKFHEQLANRGYVARAGQTIDATFVEVPRQRNSREENAAVKAGEPPEAWKDTPAKQREKDVDARWAKKNNETHYGYKNHINADREHKLVQSYAVTDASVHYRQVFEELLDQREVNGEKRTVHADSAYRSEHKEAWTQAANMPSQICEKGARGHPLTDVQRATNRNQPRIRSRGEYVFAAQAHMGRHFMRTICMLSAGMKIGMTNLVYNMVRMTLLLRRDRRCASAVA